MRNLVRRGTGAVIAAVLAVTFGVSSPAQALSYTYVAGHPLYKGSAAQCTGSWTVYGASGMFIMTAGHCYTVGARVSGTSAQFGTVAHRAYQGGQGDSELIRADPGVTMLQKIVDPHTGTSPGNGQVTGIMPDSEQSLGTLVGKMGITTGWTEGTIKTRVNWEGKLANCTNYGSAGGDSGGPVWRNDGYGLRAVGMHVGKVTNSSTGASYACYLPIESLLAQWGAQMSFYPAARMQAPEGEIMPQSESSNLPPIINAEDGWVLIPE